MQQRINKPKKIKLTTLFDCLQQLGRAENKRENIDILKKIKSFTFDDLISKYDDLEYRGFFKKEHLFPLAYKDIIRMRDTPITESLSKEIIWAILPLFRYSEQINSFLKHKEQFEREFLSGNIGNATKIHQDVISQFGYSLWVLDAGFLINSYGKKLEDNRVYLTDMTKNIDDQNSIVSLFANTVSMRIETNVSNHIYNKYINQIVNDIEEDYLSTKLAHLIQILLNHANVEDAYKISFWGIVSLTLIDRYLLLIRTLQYIYSSDVFKGEQEVFRKIIKKLCNHIYDPQLENMYQLTDPKAQTKDSEYQNKIMPIIEDYTLGRYGKVITNTKRLLCEYPECYELYEIYINSSLYEKHELENPFNINTIASDIFHKTYSVKIRDNKVEDSISSLLKIANIFGNSRLSNLIKSFVRHNKYNDSNIDHTTYETLNYSAITPRTSIGYKNPHKSLLFLDNIKKQYPDNVTISLYIYVANQRKSKKLLDYNVNVPDIRKGKYEAYSLRCSGNYKDAANKYYLLYLKTKDDILTHVDSIKYLTECLVYSKDYELWVEVVVDTYLRRPSLLLSINLLQLHKVLGPNRIINTNNICWPIYYSILYKEELLSENYMHLYELCEEYLSANKVQKIRELKVPEESNQRQRYIYYLRHVYTSKVIDNSIQFKNSEELEAELINKYQILQQIDLKESENYSNEIKKITQNAMIRKSIQRINQSKIYVDIANIKNTLNIAFPDSYNRYLEYLKLKEELRKELAIASDSIFILLSASDEKSASPEIQKPRDLTFVLFKDLFDEIGNKYAVNLDSYLSTRIRHGTLSGQIRSVFEKEKLITLKNKANVYESNEYWINMLTGTNDNLKPEIDIYFKEFSRSIDEIIEKVKTDWIQIKKDDKPKGFFDYEFSSDEYLQMHISLSDPNMNIDTLFTKITDLLNKRTALCLGEIRSKIKGELNEEIISCIDILSAKIESKGQMTAKSEVRNAIARCRTEISNCLNIVAGWFDDISENESPDFKLLHLLDTVIEIVNNPFPSNKIKPERNIPNNCMFDIKGKYFNPLVDIFFIIFENIVKHALVHLNTVVVQVDRSEDIIDIAIMNRIPEETNKKELSQELEKIKITMKIGNIADVTRKEGGSGLYKIYRILQNDLHQDPQTKYGFDVIENEGTYKIWLKLQLKEIIS